MADLFKFRHGIVPIGNLGDEVLRAGSPGKIVKVQSFPEKELLKLMGVMSLEMHDI